MVVSCEESTVSETHKRDLAKILNFFRIIVFGPIRTNDVNFDAR